MRNAGWNIYFRKTDRSFERTITNCSPIGASNLFSFGKTKMSTPAIAIIINTKPNIQFFALQCFTPMRHTPIIIFEQHSVFTLTDSYLYLRIYYLLCMKYITFFGTLYSSITHYSFCTIHLRFKMHFWYTFLQNLHTDSYVARRKQKITEGAGKR